MTGVCADRGVLIYMLPHSAYTLKRKVPLAMESMAFKSGSPPGPPRMKGGDAMNSEFLRSIQCATTKGSPEQNVDAASVLHDSVDPERICKGLLFQQSYSAHLSRLCKVEQLPDIGLQLHNSPIHIWGRAANCPYMRSTHSCPAIIKEREFASFAPLSCCAPLSQWLLQSEQARRLLRARVTSVQVERCKMGTA